MICTARLIAIFTMFVFFSGCSSKEKDASTKIASAHSADFRVINLWPEFEKFWKLAYGKSFEQQLALWNKIVEEPHQDLYDSLVFPKNIKDREERRRKRLEKFFLQIPQQFEVYKRLFLEFDGTVNEQIIKYSVKFPDARFTNKIFAVPGATFNGKSGDLLQSKEVVLAFGINVMLEMGDDTDILYSHELFHMYQHDRLNIDEETWNRKAKLTLPLWMEGLATYVSKEMNPEKPDEKVFMSKDLAKISEKDLKWMAKKFLENAEAKPYDDKNFETTAIWFVYGHQPRKDIPTRAGYYLGYRVVKELAKKHNTNEMAGWDLDKSHEKVKATLLKLSQ